MHVFTKNHFFIGLRLNPLALLVFWPAAFFPLFIDAKDVAFLDWGSFQSAAFHLKPALLTGFEDVGAYSFIGELTINIQDVDVRIFGIVSWM